MKRIMSLAVAATMLLGVFGTSLTAFGSGTAKWSEETTPDGWVRVLNEGGTTLGYSPDSGVELIFDDGYAFKDLNKNGELDDYEDWRLDYETRAMDLANKMDGKEIVPLMTHGGWNSFGRKIEGSDLEYMNAGGRSGVTRSSSYEGNAEMAVIWTNTIQSLAEKEGGYGVPVTVSADPHNISGTIDMLGLGATMNPELALRIGQEVSRQFRAVGVTMLLGPQVDVIGSPAWSRGNGAYTEDPALARDLAGAFTNGLQSTYDEEGNDIGWGSDSVVGIAKHFVGAGASEGGRFDHDALGKYSVFPGGAFNTHLIPFFDGLFELDGTESVGGIMTNYAISYSDDGSLGDYVGGAYSSYKLGLLKSVGYDGMIITDWGVLEIIDDFGTPWGMEEYTVPERAATLFELGVCEIGGSTDIAGALEGYEVLVERLGEEKAQEIVRNAAYRIFVNKMRVGLFDNPYITTKYASATVWSEGAKEFGDYSQQQAIVMLKNEGNLIKEYVPSEEKQTVYVPYTISINGSIWFGYTYKAEPCVNIDMLSEYFNVVTDTVGKPTGVDENGKAIHTVADIIRADADEIAACDLAIVKMAAPYAASEYDTEEGLWRPASIQYEEYTADSRAVRKESIAGDIVKEVINTVYGPVEEEVKENRSYYGNTALPPLTYGSYETLKFVDETVSDDCKVIVYMEMTVGGMVWSEVEPIADVIFVRYKDGAIVVGKSSIGDQVVLNMILGKTEPNGLLPVQQPASMKAVEAANDDTPRDTECYVDSEGNVYDFAFGLNWSGVINDWRVEKYNVEPITQPKNMPK